MDIKHEMNDTKGAFYFENGEGRIAELTYTRAGESKIIIDHTEVSDDYRGKGMGKALVFFAVEFARQYELSVLPLCPYAKSVFRRYDELQDVL